MKSFQPQNRIFTLTLCILAALLALSACGKKSAEPAQDAKPAESAADTQIAEKPASDDSPAAAAQSR